MAGADATEQWGVGGVVAAALDAVGMAATALDAALGNATGRTDVFAFAADKMDADERSAMLEGRTDVDVPSLVAALGHQMPGETELDVLRRRGAVDSAGCAALRRALDASYLSGAMSFYPDAVDRMPEHQLDLSRAELEGLIGAATVARLYRLPAALLARRASCGLSAEEADEAAAADDGEGPRACSWANPEPTYRVVTFARRYSRVTRPWIHFHCDAAAVTVNIALSSDAEHLGGKLLAVLDGGLRVSPISQARPAPEAQPEREL